VTPIGKARECPNDRKETVELEFETMESTQIDFWIKIAHLPLVLNQCCSEAPLKILFQQHRSNSVMEVMSAARPLIHRKQKSARDLAMSPNCQSRPNAAHHFIVSLRVFS
jgi:hypothetical protein